MLRALYGLAWRVLLPVVVLYLLWRSVRQPAYRRHWRERLGWHSRRRDAHPLIWIHAVSVGETRAVQALVAALAQQYPQARFLFTAMTPTGRAMAHDLFAGSLGLRFAQAYLPYDVQAWHARFLRAWRPTLGLLVETEVWPNMVAAACRADVPLVLINARLSERSLRRGRAQRWLVRPAARHLSLILAQTVDDARRITALGGQVAAVTGNLKFDNAPAADQVAQGAIWRQLIGRPVVLAASTREGEEALILHAWRAQSVASRAQRPLLLIVPRHPQRFDAVYHEAQQAGWVVRRRAALDDPQTVWSEVQVLIGDSMGEMAAWYSLAAVALLGGSFRPFGAQNLIEACAVGCPIVFGPSTFNFVAAAARALQAGAGLQVAHADDAVAQAVRLLHNPDQAALMAQAGLRFAAAHRGATLRTLTALAPCLAPLKGTADCPVPQGQVLTAG